MKTLLKLLMDVGVSKAAEEWMRSEGYDVLTVREIDPCMPDIDILSLAVAEQRILVTMDKDFGELVYHSGQTHAGVLLLRMEEATGAEKIAAIRQILANYVDKLVGHFCVYQNQRLRLRR